MDQFVHISMLVVLLNQLMHKHISLNTFVAFQRKHE